MQSTSIYLGPTVPIIRLQYIFINLHQLLQQIPSYLFLAQFIARVLRLLNNLFTIIIVIPRSFGSVQSSSRAVGVLQTIIICNNIIRVFSNVIALQFTTLSENAGLGELKNSKNQIRWHTSFCQASYMKCYSPGNVIPAIQLICHQYIQTES